VDENLDRTRRNARVVVVEDDDALEDLIMAWLARHGLQTVPIRGGAAPTKKHSFAPSSRKALRGLKVDHVVDLPPDLAGIGTGDSRSPTVLIVSSDDVDVRVGRTWRPDEAIEVLRAGQSATLGEWVDTFRRRSPRSKRGHIRVGSVDIDPARHSVQINGHDIRLTPTELRLLAYLAENANRVVGHAELLSSVWSPGYEDDLHLLQETIRSLRARIAMATDEELIESVYGAGYRMAASICGDRIDDAFEGRSGDRPGPVHLKGR
jgi:DNA-binding response OmpR family regulator